jgi:hypothetical protein
MDHDERTTPPPAQQALPFDDEAERPVPYALTARARLEVAPEALPSLEVVAPGRPRRADGAPGLRTGGSAPVGPGEEDGALDEPADTRPSRARALRRAGVSVADIARQLRVEELAVRAWVGDLGGRGHVGGDAAPLVALPGLTADATGPDPRVRRREQAREDARVRLQRDPGFAAGLGLMVGVGDIDRHGVGLSTGDPRLAAAAVDWLIEYAGLEPQRLRVVLRIGAEVAGDLARHAWSGQLRLPLEQLTYTRWRGAPDAKAVEALIHVTDEDLAAMLAGWAEALLEPAPTPLDAAF